MTGAGGLLRSSAVMAAGTLVSRLLGFVRTLVVAAAVGTGLVADTYNVANTLPNMLYVLLAGGVLNAVFVPQIVQALERPDGEAYVDRLLTVAIGTLLAITLLATAAAPLIVRVAASSSWTSGEFGTATAFAYWCLPQIFFYGLFTMLGQVLNARGVFGPMMWAPVLNNLVVIATGGLFLAVTALDPTDPATLDGGEIALLGAGTTLGIVVQTLALLPYVRRSGYRFRPRFDVRGQGLGKAAGLAKWTLAFVAVNQAAYLVVTRIGTSVSKEAVGELDYGVGYSAYSNAYLVFLLPHSIITVSIMTALLPRLSRLAAQGDTAGLRHDYASGLRSVLVALLPAAAAFLVLGPRLGGALYGRGEVGVDGAWYIGLLLACFAPGLVLFSAHYVTLRAFYAQEDTRTPFLLNLWIAGTDIALVLLCWAVLPLRLVTAGMALSYAASYAVGLAVSIRALRRRLGGVEGARTTRLAVRAGLAATGAGLAGLLVVAGLDALLDAGRGPLVSAGLAAAGGAALLGTYVLLARAMRIRELTDVLAALARRVR